MSRIRTLAVLAVAAVAALAFATTGFAGSGPTVKFLTAGGTKGSKVTFKVSTKNFTIDAADVGKKNKAGKGHLHFSMDEGKYDHPKYSGANGSLAVKLGVDGKYSPAVTKSITYSHLPKGKHKLEVYLVHNDHSNYKNAGAVATLRFTVK